MNCLIWPWFLLEDNKHTSASQSKSMWARTCQVWWLRMLFCPDDIPTTASYVAHACISPSCFSINVCCGDKTPIGPITKISVVQSRATALPPPLLTVNLKSSIICTDFSFKLAGSKTFPYKWSILRRKIHNCIYKTGSKFWTWLLAWWSTPANKCVSVASSHVRSSLPLIDHRYEKSW